MNHKVFRRMCRALMRFDLRVKNMAYDFVTREMIKNAEQVLGESDSFIEQMLVEAKNEQTKTKRLYIRSNFCFHGCGLENIHKDPRPLVEGKCPDGKHGVQKVARCSHCGYKIKCVREINGVQQYVNICPNWKAHASQVKARMSKLETKRTTRQPINTRRVWR
jgi:hypothetical protein